MGLRHAAASSLIAALAAVSLHGQRAGTDEAVALARAYLETWQRQLAAVVAEERYTQTLTEFPASRRAISMNGRTTTRTLVSDVLLVRAAGEDDWLMFRDVISVDGAPIGDRRRRFDRLFVDPDTDVIASARRIADESARYNIGRLTRNLNTPVTMLLFLHPRYEESVRWKGPERMELHGTAVWTLDFEQRRAPYAIRTPGGRPQPAEGRLWIEPATGRLLQAELEAESNAIVRLPDREVPSRSAVQLTARFGPVRGLEVWVPTHLIERYDLSGAVQERLRAEAVYTNHRTFQTRARIVGPR